MAPLELETREPEKNDRNCSVPNRGSDQTPLNAQSDMWRLTSRAKHKSN